MKTQVREKGGYFDLLIIISNQRSYWGTRGIERLFKKDTHYLS